MKRILAAIITLALITSFTVGCGGGVRTMLEDSKWFLRFYGEFGNLNAVIEDTEITLTFKSTIGEASGSAGCNTYLTRYEVDGHKLYISGMVSTEMACLSPEGIMEQEQEFISNLANVLSFEANDTTLTIFCSDRQILYFKKGN